MDSLYGIRRVNHRLMVERVYIRATARNARHFLNVVLKTMSVHSIQVDGGGPERGLGNALEML